EQLLQRGGLRIQGACAERYRSLARLGSRDQLCDLGRGSVDRGAVRERADHRDPPSFGRTKTLAPRAPSQGTVMPWTIEITFPFGSDVPRIRNFGEELSLSLKELGELPMDEADAATTRLVISNIRKRHLGDCRKLVTRLLRRHMMEAEAHVTQGE